MMVATIEAGARPRVTRRDTLFTDIYQKYSGFPSYDVFPDGRLLMIRAPTGTEGSTASVVVVMNWRRMLEKKGAAP